MCRLEIVNPCFCWLFKWRRGEGFPYARGGRQGGAYRKAAPRQARTLVFLVVIAGGLGRVTNQLPAGPCNEPTGRALPRAKALQHVLSDAGVTKSDEERCVVGADI